MSTSFYWYGKADCPTCHRKFPRLKIGTASCGWNFALCVYLEEEDFLNFPIEIGFIEGLDDWIKLFCREGSEIKDEYGKTYSTVEMLIKIMCRASSVQPLNKSDKRFHSAGIGTWDCVIAELGED